MKLFEVQTQLTSYTYPIIKIILSTSIILLCIFRRKIITCCECNLSTLVSIICFTLVIICILILYISIGEVFHTYSNRQDIFGDSYKVVTFSVDDVVTIASDENIVEIKLLTMEGVLTVGSSSDNKYSESLFVDKKYYIGNQYFCTLEAFKTGLLTISENSLLNVISIDGISVK